MHVACVLNRIQTFGLDPGPQQDLKETCMHDTVRTKFLLTLFLSSPAVSALGALSDSSVLTSPPGSVALAPHIPESIRVSG